MDLEPETTMNDPTPVRATEPTDPYQSATPETFDHCAGQPKPSCNVIDDEDGSTVTSSLAAFGRRTDMMKSAGSASA
jgi:hypothetical protein